MNKKNSIKRNNSANVEFGMEFGDINANKQFEIPFMNEEKGKKKNKKC